MKSAAEWEHEDPQRSAESDYYKQDWEAFIKAIQDDACNTMADNDVPITEEWLLQSGFKHVPSDLGPDYSDHLELGLINLWEFNSTGKWLINQYDRMELKTRGHVRAIADICGETLKLISS